MDRIDKNTISDLRNGSHKAFERVFTAYFSKVKAFIYGYVKSHADAEELAEDVFVALWINRVSLDPSRSFSAFLHTIARNRALNFLRHKYVRMSIPASEDTVSGVEEALIAREMAIMIDEAVKRMPVQRGEIYRLSRSEGLKNEEIATRLRTTRRNVESQLSLALKDIRGLF